MDIFSSLLLIFPLMVKQETKEKANQPLSLSSQELQERAKRLFEEIGKRPKPPKIKRSFLLTLLLFLVPVAFFAGLFLGWVLFSKNPTHVPPETHDHLPPQEIIEPINPEGLFLRVAFY